MVLKGAAGLAAVLIAGVAVPPARADEASSGRSASVWSGVYTETQAERGRDAYAEPCGKCHGFGLDGAPDDPDMFSTPPLAGPKFLRDWNGRSLAALYDYTRTTMPANNPGFLSPQEFVDILAYMLAASGLPAGAAELEPNPQALAETVIERESR